MAANRTREQMLDNVTVGDILQAYEDGEIKAFERNKMLRQKAGRELYKTLNAPTEYLNAILKRTVEHAENGIENMKEAWNAQAEMKPTVSDPTDLRGSQAADVQKDVMNQLYYTGLMAWGQIEFLSSLVMAFGEVNGQTAKRLVIAAGGSPFLSTTVGLAVEVGSGFVPWGTVFKSMGVTAQLAAKVSGAASTATKTAEEAVKATPKAIDDIKKVAAILDEGLKAEGMTPLFSKTFAQEAEKAVVEMKAAPDISAMLARTPTRTRDIEAAQNLRNITGEFTLPRELAGAKPQYNIGSTNFTPQFASDLDKALYIVAQSKPSAANEKYLQAIREYMPGVPDSVIQGMGRQVRADIKEIAKAAGTSGDLIIPKSMVAETYKLGEMAKAALAGGEAEQMSFAKYMSELVTNAPPGDKLRYSDELNHMLTGWDPESMASGNVAGAIKTLATDIANTYAKRNQLRRLIVDSQSGFLSLGTQWWGMAREAYQNLLLPFAFGGAFIGNSYATGLHVLERATGAFFSADPKDGLVVKEAYYDIKGMWLASANILKAFGMAYERKATPAYIQSVLAQQAAAGQPLKVPMSIPGREYIGSRLDFPDPYLPGRLGIWMRNVGYGTMRGVDNVFQMWNMQGALFARYYREADQLGLKGVDIGNYIMREMAGPPTREAWQEARRIALENTFQGELSGYVSKVNSALQTGPGVLYFPFMKSYANGIKYSWNRTPYLNFISTQLYKDLAAGGAAGDLAIGRLTMAMMQGEFYARLAMEGYITGSGPVDPSLNRVWRHTHEPYSVTGDPERQTGGWIPLTNMEPGSTNIGMVADVVQILDQLDDATAGQVIMAVAYSIMHNMADKTAWQNASQLMDAIQNLHEGNFPKGRPQTVLTQPITTAITGGAAGARFKSAIDPVRREAHGFLQSIVAKTPGYSSTQPPLRDNYGYIQVPPQAIGGSWFGLGRPIVPAFKEHETNPIKIEGDRVRARLPVFPYHHGGEATGEQDPMDITPESAGGKKKAGVDLTPKQHSRWMEIYNNIIRNPEFGIEKLVMNNPYYKTDVATGEPTTLDYQSQMFSDYLSDARKDAFDALLIEDKKLGDQMIRNTFDAGLSVLTKSRRPGYQQQAADTLQFMENMRPEALQNLIKYGIIQPAAPSDSPPTTQPQQELKPNLELKMEMQR